MRVETIILFAFFVGGTVTATPRPPADTIEEIQVSDLLIAANESLRAQGMDYLIEGVEFLSSSKGRQSFQLHRQDYGWVLQDPRRSETRFPGLTWAVDRSWLEVSTHRSDFDALAKSLTRVATAWNQSSCLTAPVLHPRIPDTEDLTVADAVLGQGGFGSPLVVDIVVGGFRSDLESLFGPTTLAFTITFVFVDAAGEPTDIDRDGRMDTATTEIYLNDALAWSFDAVPPAGSFDVATVALHELGHALGLPHFGAPPVASMNPSYRGPAPVPTAVDQAALCSLLAGHALYDHEPEEPTAAAPGPSVE
ncbi:MAG: matrixin family metalloprotease [Thermoanaerobaculia bacterium]|nr:matrixin family metalloprotease [Thermoanaerobaculia bacterium]